jgi:serine/threonine protein kinase
MSSAASIVEENEDFLNLHGMLLDGRFEIVRRLTRGSFSEIYLARNLSPLPDEPQTVVVKALNLWLQGEPEADMERTLIENIALEAQTMKDFRHENIVRLFSYGRALDLGGRQFYYLVLEYMPGGSLNQYCRHNPLTFEQTLSYAEQICAALSYAHARDCVHRDVKPSNIMLAAGCRKMKILDFGVARHLSNDNGLMTKVGTDLYAAPEHYSLSNVPGATLTPAADVYGLAKTIYFMLCGSPPYEFRQRQITSLPASINAETWAEECRRVLYKATHEQAASRYQSVQDFYLALQSITELTRVSARSEPAATVNRKDSRLRIVVGVPSQQPNASGVAVKEGKRSLFSVARASSSFITSCFKAVYERVSPALRNCQIGLINLRQNISCYLRTLPLKLLLRVAVVVIISLILLIATPSLIKRWHPTPSTLTANQAVTQTPVGKFMVASTDINLRSAPGRQAPKVGLVERDSKVRILRFSSDRKWSEVEIIQHGRAKEDASAADRGWVYAGALR